ncbi:MAG TPA: TfoX/Sxy family protein [Kofleriaceae bacterium]|nr:TfoX/Sxy family protein [Kofleriaceae bacterium]
MASTRSIVDYVVGQLGPDAAARPMFGEYGVYFRGTLIGLICDDRLFLKLTDAGAAAIGDHERAAPYPGAKPAIVVPEALWDQLPVMHELAAVTAAALPAPKPKPKSKSTPKSKKRART